MGESLIQLLKHLDPAVGKEFVVNEFTDGINPSE